MKKSFGYIFGLFLLLLGLISPIVFIGGVSGLIWGGKTFEGGLPKDSPQYIFGLLAMPPAMIFGACIFLCIFTLPIWAKFDVPVLKKTEQRNAITALAKQMKKLAALYSSLMDKIIEQEKKG